MEVSFSISKANLEALRAAFQRDLSVIEASAQELRDNIARIDRALEPVKSMMVTSETDPQRSYKVTMTRVDGFRPDSKTYACSCPSFQFASGLDDRSRCKHIRLAQSRGL